MTAKMTLLEMVQDIMSATDSDEVTSITDTVESLQVAANIKSVFNQMCVNEMIPEHMELIQLTTPSLVTYPGARNYLQLPTTVEELLWIKYNKIISGATDNDFRDVKFLDIKSFMDLVSTNSSSDTGCTQVTDPTSSVTYYVRNDHAPEWWTSFDDQYLAFSSYDSVIDATQLSGTKSLAYVELWPVWSNVDSFTPAIDDNLFPYLLAEAKSTSFFNLKQTENKKIDKQSRQQRVSIQRRKFRTSASEEGSINSTTGPNYGRRSPKAASRP